MRSPIRKASLLRLLTAGLLLALLSFPVFDASSEAYSAAEPPAGQESSAAAERNATYNDSALFIAGISNGQGPLTAFEGKPAWLKYAKFMSQSWERFDNLHLAPMRAWASQELDAVRPATVFYPFSGPDFVNMYTLFPHARTYLMIALEPVGEMPDFAAADGSRFFADMQRSLYDLLQLKFFITDKLNNSLGKSEIKGILPILLFFLVREKTQVLDVRYWVMKPDGTVTESPATGPQTLDGQDIAGVRVDFVPVGSEATRTLYYFRFNLRNDSWQRHEKFISFLKGFGPLTTFGKAASYLMHKPHYSGIRQFILDQSVYVLQGDSAIPVKYFDRTAWNLKFFGTYTRPINYFKKFQQKDLAEIYQKSAEVYPLPFGIDYYHRVKTSNLMIAAKRAEAAANPSK